MTFSFLLNLELKMASTIFSKEHENWFRLTMVGGEVIKLPLIDILDSEIKPVDLHDTLQSSSLLNAGTIKLRQEHLKMCFLTAPQIPNYNTFDVTLLYTLIRTLCPSLRPTQQWGKEPISTAIGIGDDIERLRLSRNNVVHSSSCSVPDGAFEALMMYIKSPIERLQKHMMAKGYCPNYTQKLADIRDLDLHKVLTKEKEDCIQKFGLLKDIDDKDDKRELEIMTCVMYGDTARFKIAKAQREPDAFSCIWQRLIGDKPILIDINEKKYAGSTHTQLVIDSVCKEDEGEYQAVHLEEKTSRKKFFLHIMGDQPVFDVWEVKTEDQGFSVQYKVHEVLPSVCNVKWTLNGKSLDFENMNYFGGGLKDKSLMIMSPTVAYIGKYSCTVTNGVGTASKDVIIDIPHAEISSEKQIYFGSAATIASYVSSCPSLVGLQWQESFDGTVFHPIDISRPKYFKSSCNPENPLLVIPKVTFEDKHHYRLLVWNIVGASQSNTLYLDVTGDRPNITVSHRTYMYNRSIGLQGNVFLYEHHPVVHKVYWTKDGQEIDRGGKYSKAETDDPSLIIFGLNKYDAGSYQLHATNAIGSTKSDIIILGIPDVTMEEPEIKEDGTYLIKVTIKSIPEPDFVQWSIKEKNGDEFEPIDVNMENFKGTSNSLPNPVLIIRQLDELEKYCFQIEVRNFIGSCKRTKLLDLTLHEQIAVTSHSKGIDNHGNVSEKKTTREEHAARPIDTLPHEKVETIERIPTEKELASVSKHIGAEFYILGLQLGLTSASIEQIRMEYSHSTQTQILKILLYWKNKQGSQATIGKLLDALKAHSNNVDIVEIERIFQCDKV